MARHLADVTDEEFNQLTGLLVQWLKRFNVAGSVASDYSLYAALQDEREKSKNASAMAITEDDLDGVPH